MHIKSLKVFCDVVARRSFSRAADANGISQSGASQIVQQLEDSLGVKLIDRSKRPFVLTPEGAVYYEGCRKIVQRFFALEEEVRTLHQEVAGRVGVASIYSIGLSHLSHSVKQFLVQNPKSNVRIEYQHPNRVYELVDQDQVDVGFVSYPKSTRTIKSLVWREEPMVLVCSPGHPFAGRESVSVDELHGIELVGFDEDLRIRREIDRNLAQLDVEPRVVMHFDNIETIKRAVEIDAGVSLLPAPSIDRETQLGVLVGIPLTGVELTRPIGLLVRRGKVLGRTAKRFIQLLLSDTPSISLSEISAFEIADEDDELAARRAAAETFSAVPAIPETVPPDGA
ncbi:MAG TPA: LysR family transcriptional regulator [Pirellulaceae bacterium]|nr:LysR family transcriptional regulator [Pirellulaceae bacterium]